MATFDTITIKKPDDWHVHLRDGAMLSATAPLTARQFARAIIMPNLADPVTTAAAGADYRSRVIAAAGDVGEGAGFTPLMTCYLTDNTDVADLRQGFTDGVFTAAKLYPAGATTNSDHGVTDIGNITAVLDAMQDMGMPLLVHGEVTDADIDVFDREAVFIDRVLSPMLDRFPALKVVFEHITTSDAAAFVRAGGPRLGATITVHHLMINRTDMFRGGIRPHLYCLPVAKREAHRLALLEAATSGEACFFLGTDSAPHDARDKEAACGCAGVFSAPTALELYTQVFDEQGALDQLQAFASENGPRFYGLAENEATVTLNRVPSDIPTHIDVADGRVIPFMAGEKTAWTLT
ncbi:MAG: dihydroorotase [Rhodospirillaceae bacterium]|jgi:dihydroorotase|nr:dihydroorotase [Rhodospirillaceae bacterium]MBT5308751.1 dihydroorotase [Rhodospirillaceae bacterium]MBT7356700.1 dihydroorotase [Rhodospirillaceae bacterium]